ncbi:hypothetical protein [Mycolicibacterium llatzerense]|nr:hypothetical protein [Mycolicibacterium llatzerense]MCT7366339.1 hypothetical protein [Mycolicibacterium llatzerense]MCT7372286.1 hypothetical protein [Mycolicibacterium llatzerense]
MTQLSIYVAARDLLAAETETRRWLTESGVSEPLVAVDPTAGTGHWDARLTVHGLASGLDTHQWTAALTDRLRHAADVAAKTEEEFDRYREYIAASVAREAKVRNLPPVQYDESQLRTDISNSQRLLLAGATRADPRLIADAESGVPVFVGPRMGVRYQRADIGWFSDTTLQPNLPADYVRNLTWASDYLHYDDISALWLHRSNPQPAGTLISAINDDGWVATDAHDVVWHVTGLDCMPPHLNRYTPISLDDLIGWTIDEWEADFVLNADNRLLRESRLSFYIDYEPADLNPGWEPRSGVGAFTGWVVRAEPEVTAEPLGANNVLFHDHLPVIQDVLSRIGDDRLEWAVAHDAIVGGALEKDLSEPLRVFVGLLIVDLILARAGYLTQADATFGSQRIEAIPADVDTATTEFVVSHLTLLRTRQLVHPFAETTDIPFDIHAHRTAHGIHPEKYPPDAIKVTVETLETPDAFDAVRRLAGLLGVAGTWSAGTSDGRWRTRAVEPM